MYEYPNTRRVVYDPRGECATFIPVCMKCGRYVKADDSVQIGYSGLRKQPNATCSQCGRVEMLFEGFV